MINCLCYRNITGVLNLDAGELDSILNIYLISFCCKKRTFPVVFPFAIFFKLESTGEIESVCCFAGEEQPFFQMRTFHGFILS